MMRADVETVIESFERAQRGGRGPTIRAFAAGLDEPARSVAVIEMVRSDIEFRWEQGAAPPELSSYWAEFPEVFDDPESRSKVAFEDFRQRQRRGESVTAAEYATEYGISTAGWAAGGTAPAPSAAESPTAAADFRAVLSEYFPDFRPVAELGRGAVGRVYLATQGDLAERLVVIKLTNAPTVEARQLARLQHTNIVPVYSVHRQGNWQLVCMPFLGYVTLRDVLRYRPAAEDVAAADGALPLSTVVQRAGMEIAQRQVTEMPPAAERAREILADEIGEFALAGELDSTKTAVWLAQRIAAGLAHAHSRGIVHSDLKPSNILIGQDGEPRLLDFHLAHQGGGEVGPWIGGTLDYMSADHLQRIERGELPDAACDLFGFGVILYQLLAGRLPYPPATGEKPEQVAELIRARQTPPPPPSRFCAGLSPDLDAIARHCLAGAPAPRYASMQDVAEDLQRHLDHYPPRHVRVRAPGEHARKWLRRHPRLRSSGFVAALGLAVVLGLTGWYLTRLQQYQQREGQAHYREWQRQLPDVEARLASATFAGDDVAQQVERGAAWLAAQGVRGEALPTWAASLTAVESTALRDEICRLETWLARGAAEASRLAATPETRQTWRDAATDYLRRGQALLGASSPPLAWQWQAYRLQNQAGSNGEDDATGFEQWLQRQTEAQQLDHQGWAEQRWMAMERFASGDVAGATALLETGLAEHTSDYAAWIVLGHCWTRNRNWERAEACYFVAHTLRPRAAEPSFYRALVRMDAGRHRQALSDFDAAIAENPENPLFYANRALCQQAVGQLPAALADCDAAMARGIRQTRIYFVRSRIQQALGNQAAAAADRARGLELEPADELSWLARGFAKAADDPAGAVADFAQALRLNPRSAIALENSAAVQADKLHDLPAAVLSMTRLIETQPTVARHYANRGVLRARSGDQPGAEQDARDALGRAQDADTLYRVAGIYARLVESGQAEQAPTAVHWLRQAAYLSPGTVWKRLAAGDPDLQPLRENPAFQELQGALEKMVLAPGGSCP